MIIREKSGRKRAKNISINDKMALYLNDALSVENAAIKRLQLRLRQTRLPDIKEQLQHHLDETKEQQNRLKRLISSLGQKPTNDRGRLPITSSPKSIEKMLKRSMIDAEEELRYAYSVCTKSICSSCGFRRYRERASSKIIKYIFIHKFLSIKPVSIFILNFCYKVFN
jgi:hypothetical protein